MALSAYDRLAILELCDTYAATADHGEVDAWVETFATNGVLAAPGGTEVRGREAIRQWASAHPGAGDGSLQRPLSRHWTNAHRISTDDDGVVHHSCAWIGVVADADGLRIGAMGEYHDQVVLEAGAWRFARREIIWEAPALPS